MTRGLKLRKSPVQLSGRPVKTDTRDHWPVVLEYAEEGPGPWLADLSHYTRFDIQGRTPAGLPEGLTLPEKPNGVRLQGTLLLTRPGAFQAALWRFGSNAGNTAGFGVTEITECTLGMAIMGKNTFRITEKLTTLDLSAPRRKPPFLLQGPFCHVPCQVVVLDAAPGREMVILSCSRGYGRDMVHAITEAGAEFDLRPAGELRFMRMLEAVGASGKAM